MFLKIKELWLFQNFQGFEIAICRFRKYEVVFKTSGSKKLSQFYKRCTVREFRKIIDHIFHKILIKSWCFV